MMKAAHFNISLFRVYSSLRLLCLSLLLSGMAVSGWAQSPTPGLIFKPATAGTPGTAVLDPNGDGYVSAVAPGATTSTGFTSAAGDLGTQSEIPYKSLPQRAKEPNEDIRVGANNKFTDFADIATTDGGGAVGFYVDANSNYMFRFRLGNSAPNSKGYSIAIDTDNKFGFTGANADPNAVAHNPGFEIEIVLATNFGVRLYRIDGTANPVGTASIDNALVELPYASYAQKAIAITSNGTDSDVFYDFYVPLSVIQSTFGQQTYFRHAGSPLPATTAVDFSLSTPLRMVANTIIAPKSVTQYQNISDIGGIDDRNFADPDNAFISLITGFTPTSGLGVNTATTTTIQARSTPPVINTPIRTGAGSVTGTSSEANGTVIKIYINGTAQSTTVTVNGGAWTWPVPTGVTLNANDLIKATATVPAIGATASKSESDFSNVVQVLGNTPCAAPTLADPTCKTYRGVAGTGQANYWVYLRHLDGTLVNTAGLAYTVGSNGNPNGGTGNPVQASATGAYILSGANGSPTNCGTGGTANLAGSYLVTQSVTNNVTNPGSSCESVGYQICISSNNSAAVITATPTVSTNPVYTTTTTITGTATAGAQVLLYVDGVLSKYVPAAASGGSFSFTGSTLPTLIEGQTLTISALVKETSCESPTVTRKVLAPRTVAPPVVKSPIVAGALTVTGTSSEAAGSSITVTMTTSGGTVTTAPATVQTNGSWSASVAALAGNTTVKATVTVTDYGTSAFSNVVTVQARTANIPVITVPTGGYLEKGTSVSGTTASPAGAIITVYEDGDIIGTATVVAGGGAGSFPNSWVLSGLSNGSGVSPNTSYPTLYSGGILTATATESGSLASTASVPTTVQCAALAAKPYTASAVCQNQAASFTIQGAESGVVYTLQRLNTADNTYSNTGVSKVGTGGNLVVPTSVFSAAGPYDIYLNVISIGGQTCSQTTATAVPVTVNPLAVDKAVTATSNSVTSTNTGTNINVANPESGVTYQLINTSVTPNAPVGPAKSGTGSSLALPTGTITSTTTYAVSAVTANSCASRMAQTQTITFSALPVELTAFEATAKDGSAVLTWATASEKNNDHFEVERSLDGHAFASFGEVKGHGSSTQPHTYTFTDAGAARFGSQVYYRLKQVDTDGTVSFSPVRTVQFSATGLGAKVLLYPNPATATVTLSLTLLPAGTYAVSIQSLTGQTLRTQHLAAGQAHDLDVAALPAGLYVVRVQSAALSLTQSLVKLQ